MTAIAMIGPPTAQPAKPAGKIAWRMPSIARPNAVPPARTIQPATRVRLPPMIDALPARFVKAWKAQNASISVYSRNILLWTAAKINIDPENAYQPSTDVQGNGIQFKQGIERYNIYPWVIPVGFKLNVTF